MLSRLSRDVRYGLRGLFAKPGFLVTVVATLALGLGVNAAIFTLFHHTLMKPLPVPEPERLVNLESPGARSGWSTSNDSGPARAIFNYPMFRDLEAVQDGAIRLAGHRGGSLNMTWQGHTSNVQGSLVTGSYFPVLGLVPALGRLLSSQDDAVHGRAEAVVLGHGFWQDRFGGDRDVIGQTLAINGVPMTIVGVAPEGFTGTTLGTRSDVFVPVSAKWPGRVDGLPEHERRDYYWLYVFGRLAPGVAADSARQRLQARYHTVLDEIEVPLLKGMSDNALAEFRNRSLLLVPGAQGQSNIPGSLFTPLTTLMLVSGLVLLMACVNIANLQLARGASRGNEMAVRSALGASAAQLRRQLLLESVLLALLGALLALPVAWLVAKGMAAFDATGMAGLAQGSLSWATVVFTFVVAVATMLVFGLFPAWRLSRSTPADALRARSGQPGSDRAAGRFRDGLAITQIAFSLALLVLAGLFARSLANIARTDLGMQVDRVLTFTLAPVLNGYTSGQSLQLFERLQSELLAQPGVDAVALSSINLLSGREWETSISVQGYEPAPDESPQSSRNDVNGDFFATLGVPVLSGRVFDDRDNATSPKVAVVNQRFADDFGLGTDAVGRWLSLDSDSERDIEIVGVVADSAYSNVKDEAPAMLYLPLPQSADATHANVYLRSAMDPAALGASVMETVRGIDPQLPVLSLRTFSEQIRENTGTDRMVGLLSAGFAVLATLLAAVGLYGLLAYTVSQRTREMGLRLALGSSPSRVRAMVLGHMARLAMCGLAVGLVLALALGNAAGSMLFGLAGHDPMVLVAAVALLALVVFAAAWWPAWRASLTDPMTALRDK